jgi:[CysO sulfur-carrier protein]-S-L-cysteine hydrolase
MSAPFRLLVPRPMFDAMVAHARGELPAECCGLLAGVTEGGVGRVTMYLPLVNALASPTEYESESRSLFAAHKAMRAAGAEVLAVYHSHPSSDPVPSRKDRERNYSEHVVNMIIGLSRAEPEVRGWWLTPDGAREAAWEVV